MTVAQMIAQCTEVLEVSNGKELPDTPFFLKIFKGLVRYIVISEKAYTKNTATHPQYLQISSRDFDVEKHRLLKAVKNFIEMSDDRRKGD